MDVMTKREHSASADCWCRPHVEHVMSPSSGSPDARIRMYRTLWVEAAHLIATLHGELGLAEDATATDIIRAAQQPFVDALIWCSGSPSFAPEGEAREGWMRVCQPLIDSALATEADRVMDIVDATPVFGVDRDPGVVMEQRGYIGQPRRQQDPA